MRIFLLGYMGAGKSTAGKKIASRMGLGFIDLDEHIEKHYGKPVPAIFEEEGEDKFRALEHQYLRSIVSVSNTVIATGGGTPCFYSNMELMNNNGITIYLKMSVDSLVKRLVNAKKKRPLIMDMSEADLRAFIEQHLEKREPFYSQAQLKIKAKDLDITSLVGFINQRA